MKILIVFLFIAVLAATSHATVAPSKEETGETGEGLLIMANSILILSNVWTVVDHTPLYWLGGLGAATGITALILSSQDPVYQGALMFTGITAVASGLIAIRYRYVINHRPAGARLEPTWMHGAPGLALVVDF